MLGALLALLAASTPIDNPPAFEATRKGTIGASFVLPGGAAPTVGVTYFLVDDLALRLDLGVNVTFSDAKPPAGFTLAAGARFYQLKREHVAVFLQPTVAFGRDEKIPAEFLFFGGAAGVEYFFTEHFSAGGTLGVNLTIGNIGGPAGTSAVANLATASSGLFANIYF